MSERSGVGRRLLGVGSGVVGVICAILADAAWGEIRSAPDSEAASIAFLVGLVFYLFAVLGLFVGLIKSGRMVLRISDADEQKIVHHKRALVVILGGFGFLGFLGSVAYLGVVGGASEESYGALSRMLPLGDIGFLLAASAALLLLAWGLRFEKNWARVGIMAFGFLFVAGFPLGTALALYIWWFTASPAVAYRFRGQPSPMRVDDSGSTDYEQSARG